MKLSLSCLVDLPDDFFERSKAAVHVKAPWDSFVESLNNSGVQYEAKLEELNGATAPSDAPKKKRGRRTKAEMAAAAAATSEPPVQTW